MHELHIQPTAAFAGATVAHLMNLCAGRQMARICTAVNADAIGRAEWWLRDGSGPLTACNITCSQEEHSGAQMATVLFDMLARRDLEAVAVTAAVTLVSLLVRVAVTWLLPRAWRFCCHGAGLATADVAQRESFRGCCWAGGLFTTCCARPSSCVASLGSAILLLVACWTISGTVWGHRTWPYSPILLAVGLNCILAAAVKPNGCSRPSVLCVLGVVVTASLQQAVVFGLLRAMPWYPTWLWLCHTPTLLVDLVVLRFDKAAVLAASCAKMASRNRRARIHLCMRCDSPDLNAVWCGQRRCNRFIVTTAAQTDPSDISLLTDRFSITDEAWQALEADSNCFQALDTEKRGVLQRAFLALHTFLTLLARGRVKLADSSSLLSPTLPWMRGLSLFNREPTADSLWPVVELLWQEDQGGRFPVLLPMMRTMATHGLWSLVDVHDAWSRVHTRAWLLSVHRAHCTSLAHGCCAVSVPAPLWRACSCPPCPLEPSDWRIWSSSCRMPVRRAGVTVPPATAVAAAAACAWLGAERRCRLLSCWDPPPATCTPGRFCPTVMSWKLLFRQC